MAQPESKRASVEFHESRTDVIVRLNRNDEYPAIANMSAPGFLDHDFYDVVHPVVFRHELDHNLRQQRDLVFVPAVQHWLSFLVPMPFGFRQRHARRNFLERFDDVLEFVRLDDALN